MLLCDNFRTQSFLYFLSYKYYASRPTSYSYFWTEPNWNFFSCTDVYPSSIKDIGLYSSIPHLSAVSTGIAGSWILDYLRSRRKTNKTTVSTIIMMDDLRYFRVIDVTTHINGTVFSLIFHFTQVHKRFIIVGQVPGACLFIALGFWKNFHWAMVIFSVFKICFSAAYASYL